MTTANVLGPIGPLRDHALAYAADGLEVFPAHPHTKAPLTPRGLYDATTNTTTVAAWWDRWPNALIAHRVPEGLLLFDLDPRHGGHTVWQAARDAFHIPYTRAHWSGRDDGGGHVWFTRPPGRLSLRPFTLWAVKRGLARPILDQHGNPIDGRWQIGIDLLHHELRYTILPPSPHPATGLPYRWKNRGPVFDLPDRFITLIVDDQPERELWVPPPPPPGTSTSDSIADWFTETARWGDLLTPHGWTVVKGDGESDQSAWRHPTATNDTSATITYGQLFVYSPNTPFEETTPGNPHGYTPFKAFAVLEHRGDQSAAAKAARALKRGFSSPSKPPEPSSGVITPGNPPEDGSEAPAGSTSQPGGPPNLPADFWEARPELSLIRQAAHARSRSADAVLGVTLARLAAIIPPAVRLPAPVGTHATLDVVVALIGRSGTGKSSSAKVAAELAPITDADVDVLPLGSGEGLIEAFFDYVDEQDEKGKTRKVKKQTKRAVLALLDEGQALAEMGGRKGATLLPTIRSAWSGDHLGQANASDERKRQLPPGSYRFAMVAGFQLEYATRLLDDVAGGTPQRFVFFAAEDPTIPDVAPHWPGQVDVPRVHYLAMTLDAGVADEIRDRALARSRGELAVDPLDAHRDLSRLKMAGLLAALGGRPHIDGTDWSLSGMILDASDRVRAAVITAARLAAQDAERAMRGKLTGRALDVEEAAEARALRSMARSFARHVHKNECGGCNRGCAFRVTSGKHRKRVPLLAALAEAERLEWVTRDADADVYRPGVSEPR